MLFEFENNYNLNTGDLLEIFSASGIHLQKDISLSFSFVDPQGNSITNDLELRNNPLIKEIQYDIIDIDGKVLYENYLVSATRSISIKEIDNIALFGEYKKDFGIRAIVSNFINDNKFISEYYLYGNVPVISEVFVSDGSGVKQYTESKFYDIFDTGAISYDKIEFNLKFLNNTNYISYDYIDIYAKQSNYPEIINENFIYRKVINNNLDLYKIEISQEYINTDEYYFGIVPYSKIGSGEVFYVGSHKLISSRIESTGEQFLNTNDFRLVNGDESIKTELITGKFINGQNEIIDIIDKNSYKTIKYTTQINKNNQISSSELKIIIFDTGYDSIPSLIEYGFGDNNFMNYRLETINSNIYLIADGANKEASYKLYKTSM
jgi:hypothetical protein